MIPPHILIIFLGLISSALGYGRANSRHGWLRKKSTLGNTNGQVCGTQNNGQSCDAGWCCGPDGNCGQGAYYCDGPDCQFQYGPACDANTVPSGPDTSAVPRALFGNIPYGVTITDCVATGVVAMTFDDGPYTATDQLLDTLNAAGIQATFFMSGNNGGKNNIGDSSNPYFNIVKKAFDSGHQIASHTWTHQDLVKISQQDRLNQMYRNEAALYNIIGMIPTYMRPPYLDCDEASGCIGDMKNLGYHIIRLNLDTNDWRGNYSQSFQYVNAIAAATASTSQFITLAHDILNQTVTSLVPYMIQTIQKAGFKTATIGDCLGDPPVNWYRDMEGNPSGPGGSIAKFNVSTKDLDNLSPDGTCGPPNNYYCPDENKCCSQYGYW
jgi:peptidoglycan/xylan/chitin deacetylase (PgdA/CDA1 family)